MYFIWESVGNQLACNFSCISFENQLGVSWNVIFRAFRLEAVGKQLEVSWDGISFGNQLGISWESGGC